MIEHPVPQNITSYQFRLVGDMTLKQFLELAAGIGLAWIIWSTALPSIIKFPLAIFSLIFGFAIAFLPIEERPLDQWLAAFFTAIYHPTIFTWKKSKRSDIFDFQPSPVKDKAFKEAIAKAPSAKLQTLLEAYQLQNTPPFSTDPLEDDWIKKGAQFNALFEQVSVPARLTAETNFPQRKTPPPPPSPTRQPLLHPLSQPENPTAIIHGEITLPPRIIKVPPSTAPTEINISSPSPVVPNISTILPSIHQSTANQNAAGVTSNPTLPMPNPPTHPNILSGMVLTADGCIAENAIIEIRDQHGLPVRAIKTNKLGQFTIATPLPNGTYEMEIEKEGHRFDILKLETEGKIIPPIEIKAKTISS